MKTLFCCILASFFIPLLVFGQCPGAFSCEGAEVQCAGSLLNGLTCQNSSVPNTSFPLPSLCFGSGTPQNLKWWAFAAEGGPFSVSINYDLANCEAGNGLEAGLLEDGCEGNIIDCNADCGGSGFTLNGNVDACQVVYLWVDGCDGDLCTFTLSLSGNIDSPKLPTPLPSIVRSDGSGACPSALFYIPWSYDCIPSFEWTVDGVTMGFDRELLVNMTDVRDYEICYKATIGNPMFGPICSESTKCQTFQPTVEEKTGALRKLCTRANPYVWHGTPITQSCITPPCSARVFDNEGCLVDSLVPFQILPPETHIGKKQTLLVNQLPFFWHNQVITASCINPPCSARVELADGCLVDSLKQFEVLFLPPDTARVKGQVFNDLNNNCQRDPGEPTMRNIQISIEGQNRNAQTLTNASGYYEFLIPRGDYIMRAQDLTDSLFACPVPVPLEVTRTDSNYCVDFYKFPANCYPGRLQIEPLRARNRLRCDPVRRTIHLYTFNTDNEALAPERIIVQADSLVEFVDATLPFNQISPTEIAIDLPSIPAGEKLDLSILFDSDCDRDNLQDEVCFTARYEAGYLCNGKELLSRSCEVILNSFDPNDLTITPHGVTPARYIARESVLRGLIRYHNTGTDTAYDIRVELDLEWEKLDQSSIQLINGSAPTMIMDIGDSSVTFDLPNVRLPHNDVDSINSHGYILYEIQPKKDIPDWTLINQQAFIYFDFNAPIATNMELQNILGEFLERNNELALCVGDTFLQKILRKDTTISDTILTEFPKKIDHYLITAYPSYEFTVDTQILAGNNFLGNRIFNDTVITQKYQTQKGCDSLYHYEIEALTTGINSGSSWVKVYPNPASNKKIWLQTLSMQLSSMDIWATNGKTWSIPLEASKIQLVDLSHLPSGTYFYRVDGTEHHGETGYLVIP